MGVPGERMMEESYATLSWNQPPVKFKAERRFHRRCSGSSEGILMLKVEMQVLTLNLRTLFVSPTNFVKLKYLKLNHFFYNIFNHFINDFETRN